MKAIHDRMELVRDILGLSQVKLAERLRFTQQYVSEVCNGRKEISGKFAKRFAEAFPWLSLNWLITGKGPLFLPEHTPEDHSGWESMPLARVPDLHGLAGVGKPVEEWDRVQKEDVWLPRNMVQEKGKYRIVYPRDGALEPVLPERATVLVKLGPFSVEDFTDLKRIVVARDNLWIAHLVEDGDVMSLHCRIRQGTRDEPEFLVRGEDIPEKITAVVEGAWLDFGTALPTQRLWVTEQEGVG